MRQQKEAGGGERDEAANDQAPAYAKATCFCTGYGGQDGGQANDGGTFASRNDE